MRVNHNHKVARYDRKWLALVRAKRATLSDEEFILWLVRSEVDSMFGSVNGDVYGALCRTADTLQQAIEGKEMR